MRVYIKPSASGRKRFAPRKQTVFARTTEILNELGIDRKQYERDVKFKGLCRMMAQGMNLG